MAERLFSELTIIILCGFVPNLQKKEVEQLCQSFFDNFRKLLDFQVRLSSKSYCYGDAAIFAIAVSGGADSTCMAWLMHMLQKQRNVQVIALIVDHGLRDDSAEEAYQVRNYLQDRMKIESHVLRWEECKPKSNVHYHARHARYNLLTNYCLKYNIRYLCTAHNKDDQAETVLLRILRGSGIGGICGIPEINYMNDIIILRPLLIFRREVIEKILNFYELHWVDDPSNTSAKYDRAKLRVLLNSFTTHQVIQSNEMLVNRLVLLSENAARAHNYIETVLHEKLANLCKISEIGSVLLDCNEFMNLHSEIALRMLRYILQYVGGNEYCTRLRSLELLLMQLWDIKNFKNATLGKCKIIRIFDKNTDSTKSILFFKELKFVDVGKYELMPGQELLWDSRIFFKREIVVSCCSVGEEVNQLYVAPISADALQYVKKELGQRVGGINLLLFCNEALMTMPVVYAESNKPILYPLLNIADKRYVTKNSALPKIRARFKTQWIFK
ncbi:tRNA(Ile)-lysidine synthase [Alphaproteobacteria bacterium]